MVWQSMPMERDVMSAVHYMRIVAYCNFAGLFIAEKYPHQPLYQCPSCEGEAIATDICEASRR